MLSPIPETPQCWNNHLGLWCVEAQWFTSAVHLYRQGLWQAPMALVGERVAAWDDEREDRPSAIDKRPYELTAEGTALIRLEGPLSKAGSYKFGGSSTVGARRALRQAVNDKAVQHILLMIDSPGGHVSGTEALAQDVAQANLSKPVIAQVEDLGASAAYWIASQAQAVYANATAEVGSIGTVLVVEDSSGRMDRMGIKVHVLSTGAYKGAGADGAAITEQQLVYLQERVDNLNTHFLQAVRQGRSLTPAQLAQASDGRVHIAAKAYELGLLDGVQSLDTTLATIASLEPRQTTQHRQRAARLAAAQAVSLPPISA